MLSTYHHSRSVLQEIAIITANRIEIITSIECIRIQNILSIISSHKRVVQKAKQGVSLLILMGSSLRMCMIL